MQRSIDEFMFEAPAEGYSEKIELAIKASNPVWKQHGTIRFFARTSAGHYGRFTLEISGPYFADEPRARVTINGAVNPTG